METASGGSSATEERVMETASGGSSAIYMSRVNDNELFAHAALVLVARRQRATVEDAVDYLYCVADDIGVEAGELARVVVIASERRARGMSQVQRPLRSLTPHQDPTSDTA